jgi:hypothetical protein
VNLPPGFLARLGQGFKKILPVNVVQENVFAPVTPIHHTVNGAGEPDPQLARHMPEGKAWTYPKRHYPFVAPFLVSR